MTGAEALTRAIADLRAAGLDDAARDARRLLAHALGIEAGRLSLNLPEPLAKDAEHHFFQMVAMRSSRRPLSQIVGYRDFYGRRFQVSPDVLDPRPETETLIAAARSGRFRRVLDLGTGSGCILLTLLAEQPQAIGLGLDISPEAIRVAERNAMVLHLGGRTALAVSDWYENALTGYDLIVSNPPYIAADEMDNLAPELSYEPRMALTDEDDGLSAYRAITAGAGAHLAQGGRLMVEIGPSQAAAVSGLFRNAGMHRVRVLQDLDGRDRVVVGNAA